MAIHDIGYEQDGFSWKQRARSPATCTRSPPTSPRASTPPATRTRAPATRASCSATPAARPPTLMPAPLYYAHEILRRIRELRRAGDKSVAGPAAGRQEPGDAALRRRQAGRRHQRRGLHPARGAAWSRPRSSACCWPIVESTLPEGWMCAGGRVLRQPDRQVRDRRAGRRLRPDRAQDHRRHLWRRRPARRWRVQRQGSDQGGPLAPPMPAAIWRRTSWRRDWPIAAPSRSATRSASSHPLSVYVDLQAPARTWTRRGWSRRCAS